MSGLSHLLKQVLLASLCRSYGRVGVVVARLKGTQPPITVVVASLPDRSVEILDAMCTEETA